MELARVVFFPPTPVPWMAATVAFALLTPLGFQRIPIIGDFTGDAGAISQAIPLLLLLGVFNAALTWFHVRPFYLRPRDSAGAALGTFLLLSTVFLLIYRFVIPGPSKPLISLVIAGQLGVYLTLAASQLWATPKPALDTVRVHRDSIIELLDRCKSIGSLQPEEKTALDAALTYVRSKAADSSPGVRLKSDRVLLHRWIRAAASVDATVSPLDSTQLRPSHCAALKTDRDALASDSID